MSNKRFGYARTSTIKQDNGLETQIEALKKAKCDKIYSEQISGRSKNRPELNKMLDNLREGDVVVSRLDRLARSLHDLFSITKRIEEAGASFLLLDHPSLDTTTSSGKLLFSVLGALAEFERSLIVSRTKAGREAALERNPEKNMGRPFRTKSDIDEQMRVAYEMGKSYNEIAETYGVSRMTAYRRIRPLIEAKKAKEAGFKLEEVK